MAYCVFNLDSCVLWFNRYGLHERTKKFVKIHGCFVHIVPRRSTNSSYYGFIATGEGINYYSMLKLEVLLSVHQTYTRIKLHVPIDWLCNCYLAFKCAYMYLCSRATFPSKSDNSAIHFILLIPVHLTDTSSSYPDVHLVTSRVQYI